MGNILEIKDLSKNFKGLKAVDGVSFAVEEGGITGLIGSNGAGKTTVFNMISGVFPPTAGHIIYKNKEITGMKPYHYTSMGIARTFQIMNLWHPCLYWITFLWRFVWKKKSINQ